jgi:hypothetical protein
MPDPKQAHPDTVLAFAVTLRRIDQLLDVADELRHAKDELETQLRRYDRSSQHDSKGGPEKEAGRVT